MSVDEERLYGLMEIAERQQAAVQTALNGLAAERAAFARERGNLAAEAKTLGRTTREAAAAAVVESFAHVGVQGVEAVRKATDPLITQLAGVTASAAHADATLRKVASWAGRRLLLWIMGLMVSLVLLGWLISHGLIWWDTGTVTKLRGEIADLQNKITELKANRDTWVKAGMLDKLQRCDPGNKPCVAVDESAGAFGTPGQPHDIRVLKGY